MTEPELIKKIQELKQIKPRKDWVVLTKRQIFKPPTTFRESFFVSIFSPRKWLGVPRLLPYYKPVLATFVFLGIIIVAAISLAQNALPGDSLYSLKRISEESRIAFVSEENKPKAQLELANKRLEELSKVAEAKQTQKLAPAIDEFQASTSQVAKNLKEPKKITEEIVKEAKKLEENKEKIEALGIIIGETEELDSALSQLVEREIKDLGDRTLTEDQQQLLEEAKEDFDTENFTGALEKIIEITAK